MAETNPENSRADKQTEYITVGEVLGAWGLKGAFRVRPTTDFPERFEPGETVFIDGVSNAIQSSNWQMVRSSIAHGVIRAIDTAAKLRRKTLDIPASQLHKLPEGQYYHFDIIGMEVQTMDGAILGKVTEILNCGNDVYVVKGEGKEILIPATKDVVKSIDLKTKKMVIEPIEGLLG